MPVVLLMTVPNGISTGSAATVVAIAKCRRAGIFIRSSGSAAISEMKRAGMSVLLCEQNAHFAQSLIDRSYRIEKGRVRAS